jgi:ribose transport system ATP-binding protein
MNEPRAAVLHARGLTKRHGGVEALSSVDLELRAGEVHAVVGENGAGKSTLLRILGGVHAPDAGSIEIARAGDAPKPVALRGVRAAQRAGIALVHQELNLAENLDLAGAIFLGREPARWGILDRARMRREARRWLDLVGLAEDAGTTCEELPIAKRQLVEIARALACDARVLVLDEPTSSLSAHEVERLERIIDGLRARGTAIAFVSHHLDEVLRLADRVTVLRDGRMAGHAARGAFDRAWLERTMVGRAIEPHADRPPAQHAAVRLRLHGVVSAHRRARPASLEVRGGEIVALAGLVGSGRTELLEAIAGLTPHRGAVELDGTPLVGPASVRVARGVGIVPEDRARDGLFLPDPVSTNVSAAWIGRGRLVIDRPAEGATVRGAIARVGLRTADPSRAAGTLSGGNQQKALVGRWTAVAPAVLLLDEPTRGVDVGARADIHAEIRRLAAAGTAVLLASSELEEVLLLADRVVVMHDGSPAGELPGGCGEVDVMRLATGGGPGTHAERAA